MGLENKVRDAFDCVKADEGLKDAAKEFLRDARQRESCPGAKRRLLHPAARLAFVTACAMLAVFLGIGSYAVLWMPVAYVSIDVNPSLELELNRLDRVIDVRAYNADGEEIAGNISVKGLHYEDAIERIVSSEKMRPYLTEDAALTFTVATASALKEERMLAEIARSSGCLEHGGSSVGADMSLVGEAHENGLSLGKYLAYRLLVQYEPSVTVQDCHDMSMSQLHGMLEEHEHGTSHGDSQGEHETGHETEHGTEHKGQYEGVQESEYPMEYDGHKSGHGH
nr:hypothetical protein [uncultured Acetatifactor sp.]